MLKLFRFLKPYRFAVALILGLTFLQALTQLYLPTLMARIVDQGIADGDLSYIVKIGSIMLLVAAGGVIFSISASYYSAKVSMGFSKVLRNRVFSRVEHASLQAFEQIGTASLITRTTNDIMQVQQVLTLTLRIMITAPMMFIVGIIMTLSTDASLSWVIIATIPVITAAMIIVAKKGIPLFKTLRNKLDQLNLVQREGLTGIRVIRAFNRTDHEKQRFNATNLDFRNTSIKVNQIMATLTPILTLVLNFAMIAIIWFGSFHISSGHLQVGALMAFIQYATQIMFSLIMGSMMFVVIPRASVSAGRINEILDVAPETEETDLEHPADEQRQGIAFQHVTFSYPGAQKPVISDVSFHTKPGEVTAIIGGTGAGKSTLLRLLPRFYDADSGHIFVDGADVRAMKQASLRNKIGFASQKSVLFSGTIADNIRYGKEAATDEEVREAADVAQATSFIHELKDGFDTHIAQGGANVSGGQKQRLAIARALVKKPEIYVFDDSFSALDVNTEARLWEALQKETAEAAVFVVAQRVSTVMNADRMVVLEEGEVAGIGTHRELMNHCKVYQEIVASQLSEEESA